MVAFKAHHTLCNMLHATNCNKTVTKVLHDCFSFVTIFCMQHVAQCMVGLRPPYTSCNQVVTRVKQLCYRADTTLLQLLQATKLPQECIESVGREGMQFQCSVLKHQNSYEFIHDLKIVTIYNSSREYIS